MTTYLITGVTGYIGSALIKRIFQEGQRGGEPPNVRIIAPVRNLQKAGKDMPYLFVKSSVAL